MQSTCVSAKTEPPETPDRATDTPDTHKHAQAEHKEGVEMTQVNAEKLNCMGSGALDCNAQPFDQDHQEPIGLVSKKKKRKLKTFPKFPKSKKSVLVIPIFIDGHKTTTGHGQ